MSVSIQVKWGRKKFPVEFHSVQDMEATPVKELKAHIQRMTGVDPSSMRLQAFGGISIFIFWHNINIKSFYSVYE